MIYFIGFMGVGKTTIAKQFALQNNINFIDTDKEIEIMTNKKISEIFEKEGEDHFRNLETKILRMIRKGSIVACGGGLPLYNNNIDYIKKSGKSIYLQASTNEIFNRLSKNLVNRPLLQNKSTNDLKKLITKKMLDREEIYSMADYTINTNNISKENILRKINSLSILI